ncbi:MAG: CaiB/BaiF CoA-transferase family protein [Myxococcota bacterium]|nr:CaiB/BaiF CoA-transferase family protein [Myxococcota bacterium]
MAGPLGDYRVLELTSTVSGPMAAMILADQGADVIKIEPPLLGDKGRFLGSQRRGMGAMFAVLNRNKRSLVLDLKNEDDKNILIQLVEGADVLLENYRPGVAAKLGIDYATLSKINPRLVYASISGYGQSGPYQNRKVFDPLIQASTGIADAQGGDKPQLMASIVFDKVTALTTAQTITAALLDREKTGRGQHLPISMLESALYYAWPDVMWSRTLIGDGINHAGEIGHWFQIYKVKDGYVSIVLVRDDDLEVLSIWQGATLHTDERYQTFPARLAHATEFQEELETLLADLTTDEICENLDAFNIPVARVNSLDEVHEDPQIVQQESLIETTHPVIGDMRYPRPPFNFEGQPAFPRRHAAFPGDHAREILNELAVDESEIERLEARDRATQEFLKSLAE